MAFLCSAFVFDDMLVLHGRGLILRMPNSKDYSQLAKRHALSRERLRSWETEWAQDESSRTAFRRRICYYQKDLQQEQSFVFFMINANSNKLIGGLTLFKIRRGAAQVASIGCWTGKPYTRTGYITNAVGLAVDFVFTTLHLRCLEAACLAMNKGSIAVLRGAGFQLEGVGHKYLKIKEKWQNHVLFALLDKDYYSTRLGKQ